MASSVGSTLSRDGSGTPLVVRLAAILGALFVLGLISGAATAAASKKIDSFVGSTTSASSGTTAGLFNTPRGIAVNQNGTGGASAGDIYVVDSSNNRIQQFRANRTFVRAFGLDVVASGPDNASEVQWVAVNATEGTFKLTFNSKTTSELPFNATAGEVQAALNALESISGSGGSVTVGGGPGDGTGSAPYVVTFNGGPLKGTNVNQMTGASGATPLAGGAGFGANEAKVTTANSGATGYEVCDALANPTDVCKQGLSTGGLGGTMSSPQGIAIDQATGNLYVTDSSNRRIQRFSATGTWQRAFGWDTIANGAATGDASNLTTFQICTIMQNCKVGVAGANAGQLSSAVAGQPATDSAGNLYVADVNNRRVQKFDALGTFLSTWGWDVVPAGKTGDTGTGLEACPAAAANAAGDCQAGAQGAGAGQFGSSSPTRIAVDSTAKVYALDNGNKRIQSFDSVGGSPATFLAATGPEVSPTDIAIGPSNRLFVAVVCPNSLEGNAVVCPGGALNERRVKEFDSAGTLLDTHLVGVKFTSATNALAANPTNDRVYFSTSATVGHRVWILDDDGALPAPAATLNPVTDITAHSASFSGAVNPNGPAGLPTSYRFEYSKDGVTWTPVATDVGLGDGVTPVTVPVAPAEGAVTGLEANTFYRVRIAAYKAFGSAAAFSPELTFLTDTVGPEVQTLYPQTHTDTTARLTGLVNPNNLPTSYYFEYGTSTKYGSRAPVPDGSLSGGTERIVLEVIGGLAPETTYHYRLVSTNSQGTTVGGDVSFATSPALAPPGARAYEQVTPPFKATRNTGNTGGLPGKNSNPAMPSIDGDTVLWSIPYFPLADDVAVGGSGDRLLIRRGADGWKAETLLTVPRLPEPPGLVTYSGLDMQIAAMSGDLETQTWGVSAGTDGVEKTWGALLPSEGAALGHLYTRRDGTGVNGWNGWLTNPEASSVALGLANPRLDKALLSDDSSWMTRWGRYRGVLGSTAAEDPSVTQLSGAEGGSAVYLQASPPTGAVDLVNECTGSLAGGNATEVPARSGTGVAGDTISSQPCEEGAVPSVRGAQAGGGGGTGVATTATAADGRTVFFTSPDYEADEVPSTCSAATGAATSCPPQLFVRQYDAGGEPTVRWISRSRSVSLGDNRFGGAMISGQQIAEMGAGAQFQGASKDGRIVYFQTNAPLTPDDPNGGKSITTDSAQDSSWDLYRYELPSHEDDPDEGALTRVSGGPTGTSDPSTNLTSVRGVGAAARYISDDGRRVFFVTAAPISGIDPSLPQGGTTAPGGTATNSDTRNLYLYDDTKDGAARWSFIARLPFSTEAKDSLDGCATFFEVPGPQFILTGYGANAFRLGSDSNCVRGTADGSAITFITNGRLTGDDVNDAADVYLYDARSDELRRVTASDEKEATPYLCSDMGVSSGSGEPQPCYGDFGTDSSVMPYGMGWAGARHFNIAEDSSGAISVFFESLSALVSADDNENWDVYEWREGELSLVSTGAPEDDAYYSGASEDGRTVFFQTTDRIDPRDLDDADNDIYAARIGGGFPYTPPPTPCDVLTFQCEAAATPPPALRTAGTAVLNGPGNGRRAVPRKGRCGKGKVRRKGRCMSVKRADRKGGSHHRRAADRPAGDGK